MWLYIYIVPLSVTDIGFQTLLANQKNSFTPLHPQKGSWATFYIPLGTLDAVYTDRRKNLGEHAIHI